MVVVRRVIHLRFPEGREAGPRTRRPRRLGIDVIGPVDELVIEVDTRQAGRLARQAKIRGLNGLCLPSAGFHGLAVRRAVEAHGAHVQRLPPRRQQGRAAQPRLAERIDRVQLGTLANLPAGCIRIADRQEIDALDPSQGHARQLAEQFRPMGLALRGRRATRPGPSASAGRNAGRRSPYWGW